MKKLLGFFSLIALLLGFPAKAAQLIHQEQSHYQQISVTQTGETRCMQFDNPKAWVKHFQTCMNVQNPAVQPLEYTKLIMGSLFLKRDPKRVLVIGLGGGVLPTLFSNLSPDAYVEAVEIDPAVVRIAKDYFFFLEDSKRKVYVADGRLFVREALKKGIKYDLVVIDAFNGEYIPEHLMTQDFLKEVQGILTEGGVVASNTFSRSRLYDHESATYHSVFGDFRNLKKRRGNRVILATRTQDEMPTVREIQENAKYYHPVFSGVYGISVNQILPLMSDVKDWDLDARVMTDQFAPANLLQDKEQKNLATKFFYRASDFAKKHPIWSILIFFTVVSIMLFGATKLFSLLDKNKES